MAVSLVLTVPVRCADGETSIRPIALPPLRANGAAIVDDKGRSVVLRGCNLGNWLLNELWMMEMSGPDDPKDHWQIEELLQQRFGAAETDRLLNLYRENWIKLRDFDVIKSWGFNVVRLPFYYGLLEDDAAPGQLRPDAFQWLDRAIAMATDAGIYVIVDMHGAPGGQSSNQCTGHGGQNKLWLPQNRKRAAFLWKKIAERYRDNPTVAAYDLLNEPYGDFHGDPPDSTIVTTMDELVHAIREVDQRHLILCAGSLQGIAMYGAPASHGWKNVGYTEHFYPGLFGGVPSLETHARFISLDLRGKAELLKQWNVPFLAGEFNVVFDKAGGAAMMRRYYDVFASNGWAATMWSYKIVKQQGGRQPDNWYMVTNRDDLKIPHFRSDSKDEIESFFRTVGTMEYAQDDGLRIALTSRQPPALTLQEYPVISGPAPQDRLSDQWESVDIGEPLIKGGQRVLAKDRLEIFGAGRDVFEGNDECHFISRKAGDHFELSASLTPPVDTDTYAKAGLMYRTSLNADAPIVIVSLNPDGACTFAYRKQSGARLTESRLASAGQRRTVRLVRNGARFEATALDGDGKPLATQSTDLPDLAAAKGSIGLFVLSHEPMLLSKATFTNIQLYLLP
ncbi:MAG: cellulase family glycosylhydrolase [Verrucomicrobiia bacterium]